MFGSRASTMRRTKSDGGLGISRIESTCDSLFIDENDFEEEPANKPCGISMQYVNKRYSSVSRTLGDLRNVNVNIYEGDVYVFLGRHLRENETILKLLAGYEEPTTGNILLKGVPVSTFNKLFPLQLIWCLSEDIFCANMTVKENLYFFAKLCGISRSVAKERVEETIKDMVLEKYQNTISKKLPIALKRKLAIAVSFINKPEIVILDEPTRGMDLESRTDLAAFLEKGRKERTVLILTRNLTEAHLLGNRIGVLGGGVLQCSGSLDFLRARYGAGYQLAMKKLSPADVNVEQIMKHLEKVVPSATVLLNTDQYLTIHLAESEVDSFSTAFSKLLSYGKKMRLHRYELMYMSLEESLTLIENKQYDYAAKEEDTGTDDQMEFKSGARGQIYTPNTTETLEDLIADAWKNFRDISQDALHLSGWRMLLAQFQGLIIKRFLQTQRAANLLCLQFFASILPIVMSFLLVYKTKQKSSETSVFDLRLKPQDGRQEVLISLNSSSSAYDAQSLDIIRVYMMLTEKRRIESVPTKINGSLRFKELYKSCNDSVPESFLIQCFKNTSQISLAKVRRQGQVAAVFAGMTTKKEHVLNIKLFYNEDAYYAAAINLNYIYSAILNVRTNGTHTLSASVQPFSFSKIDELNTFVRLRSGVFFVAKYLFSVCLTSTIWMPLLMRERISKAKLILLLEGVHPFTYWYANLVWDYALYALATGFFFFISITQRKILQLPSMLDDKSFYLIVLMYLTFGFATIPFNYFLSTIFVNNKKAILFSFSLQVIAGLVAVLRLSKGYEKYYQFVMLPMQALFPTISATKFLHTLFINGLYTEVCTKINPPCSVERCCYRLCRSRGMSDCFDWSSDIMDVDDEVLSKMLVIMILQGVIYFILCLLTDSHIHSSLNLFMIISSFLYKRQKASRVHELLKQEETYCDAFFFNDYRDFLLYNFVAKDIWSQYSPHSPEVKNLSFSVKAHQSFVILGPNTSGKTSVLQMIVGDEEPAHGDMYLHGYPVQTYPAYRRRNMGYCPQTDVFFENLTCFEILMLSCRMRGIRQHYRKTIIAEILESFNITRVADDYPTNYSPSNKRKMSVLLSLIGNPPLVIIDEPTSHASARAKKQIWACLNSYRAHGGSLIVTSTNVEECEAIGTHVAVMYSGKFQCRGPLKQIKQHFEVDYILQMVLPTKQDSSEMTNNIRKVVAYMRNLFPKARLESFHAGVLRYRIKVMKKYSLAEIFETMEAHKDWLGIKRYSVSKDSLQKYFSYYSTIDETCMKD